MTKMRMMTTGMIRQSVDECCTREGRIGFRQAMMFKIARVLVVLKIQLVQLFSEGVGESA